MLRLPFVRTFPLFVLLIMTLPLAAQTDPLTPEQRQVLLDSARSLEQQQPEDAVVIYRRLAYHPDGSVRTDSLAAHATSNLARLLRRPLRRVDEALAVYRDRITWLEGQPEVSNEKRLVFYQYLGSVAFFEGRYDVSRRYLRLADHFAQQADRPDPFVWMDALRLLCNIAADDYDADLVRSTTRRGTALYEQHHAERTDSRFDLIGREVFLDAADARRRIQDFAAARRYAYRGLEIGEKMGDNAGIIRCLNLVALAEETAGNYPGAIAHHERAIGLYEADPERAGEISYIYNNKGLLHRELGEHQQARAAFLNAQETMKPWRIGEALPSLLAERARTEATLGRPAVADTLFREALRLISNDNLRREGDTRLAVADSVELYYELQTVYESRLESLLEQDLLREALVVAEEMTRIQDRLRAGVITEGSRNFNSAVIRLTYDALVRISVELGRETNDPSYYQKALAYSDRARSHSLLAALDRRELRLSEEEQQLRAEIARLERRAIFDTTAYSRLDRARLDLRTLVAADSNKVLDRTLDFAALEDRLAADSAVLISFHAIDTSDVFTFLLPPGEPMRVYRVEGGSEISAAVHDLREAIIAGRYTGKGLREPAEQRALDERMLSIGTRLFEALLPDGLPPARSCWVVPDGELHQLPFAALPLPQLPGDSPTHYLGAEYPLRLAYDLASLTQRREPSVRPSFVGFAPSFSGAEDVYALNTLRSARDGDQRMAYADLNPLYHNQTEVERITEVVGRSTAYLGGKATRERFVKEVAGADVLHLSTHGYVDARNEELSFVAFAPVSDSLYADDLLYYNELALLPIDADLVVLAACETSLGKVAPGETALSMASAFTAAGAASTLTTLWQVDDAATAELMVAFYRELAAGLPKDEALFNAQRMLVVEGKYAHPYFWSGAVLHGDPVPLSLAKSGGMPWWLVGLGLAGLGGGLLLGLRRK